MHLLSPLLSISSQRFYTLFTCANDPTLDPKQYPIKPYKEPPPAATGIRYSPLVEIDFSNWDEPGEKQRPPDQLHAALRDVGFYIVREHGITDEEVLEILAIANILFPDVELDEKRKNPIDLHAGQSFGYRELRRYCRDTGIKETLETVRSLSCDEGVEANVR